MAQGGLERDFTQCPLHVGGAGRPLPKAGQLNLGVPLDTPQDMPGRGPEFLPLLLSPAENHPAWAENGTAARQSTSLLSWLIDTVPSNAQGHSATILCHPASPLFFLRACEQAERGKER